MCKICCVLKLYIYIMDVFIHLLRIILCLLSYKIILCFQVPQSELDLDTVKTILSEYRIHNADVVLKADCTSDELIDVIEGNRIYIPCIYVLNKIDQISIEVNTFSYIVIFYNFKCSFKAYQDKFPLIFFYINYSQKTNFKVVYKKHFCFKQM